MNEWKEVLDIIDKIDDAKGNAKHPLIIQYLNTNILFAKVVEYTLNTSRTFKCKKIKWSDTPDHSKSIFNYLDYLDSKSGATKAEKEALGAIASCFPEKFAVIEKLLDRKLRCGLTVKTLNNLLPGFVPYFEYMRCSGLEKSDNIVFPCYSQLKADGEYFDVFVPNSDILNITFQTRNGKVADFSLIDTTFVDFSDDHNGKISGEALLLKKDGSGYENRKDGNAIINKALYGNLSQSEADRIRFAFWDIVFDGDDLDYEDRWDDLGGLYLPIIECKIVYSWTEVWEHYDDVRKHGLEGTVLKNFKGKWIDGTSPDQVKIKAEKECELEVYDIVPSKKGKYEGMVGSLMCKSSCGQLITDVGMGLSDEDRVRDDWIGKIITVRFNAISRSKAKTTWAMTHARLVDDRPDKIHADDLVYIRRVKEIKRK